MPYWLPDLLVSLLVSVLLVVPAMAVGWFLRGLDDEARYR